MARTGGALRGAGGKGAPEGAGGGGTGAPNSLKGPSGGDGGERGWRRPKGPPHKLCRTLSYLAHTRQNIDDFNTRCRSTHARTLEGAEGGCGGR